jgi:hypothetical protein
MNSSLFADTASLSDYCFSEEFCLRIFGYTIPPVKEVQTAETKLKRVLIRFRPL